MLKQPTEVQHINKICYLFLLCYNMCHIAIYFLNCCEMGQLTLFYTEVNNKIERKSKSTTKQKE